MHKLDRSSVALPTCLVAPDPELRYENLRSGQKAEIRDALLEMQKHRCAYCERRTGEERDDGHIEHFRKQADFQLLDRAWSNLFWSCQDEKSCGKHKDKCDRPIGSGPQASFDANDLIDPCVDDPERFLQFLSDGTVRPHNELETNERRRATETIRIFQLGDSAFLRKSREDAVRPYKLAVDSLLAAGLDFVKRYLASVETEIADAPFCTVIRQYLRGIQN